MIPFLLSFFEVQCRAAEKIIFKTGLRLIVGREAAIQIVICLEAGEGEVNSAGGVLWTWFVFLYRIHPCFDTEIYWAFEQAVSSCLVFLPFSNVSLISLPQGMLYVTSDMCFLLQPGRFNLTLGMTFFPRGEARRLISELTAVLQYMYGVD